MAEELAYSKEGAASINEADSSPKSAFEDLKRNLMRLGMSEDEITDKVVSYCKERAANPLDRQDAYRMAFYSVVSQWVLRLMRYGGYTKDEIPAVLDEFAQSLRSNTGGEEGDKHKREHIREIALNSLASLYYGLRVRGVSDEELKAASQELAEKVSRQEPDSIEGMRGISGVGAVQALADNLSALRKYGLTDDVLKEVGNEMWEQVHSGDQSARLVWKKAFFGVLTQWMYRLSLEAGMKGMLNEIMADAIGKLKVEEGRDVEDMAEEAIDSFYAYMMVAGYSNEEIQNAIANLVMAEK